MPTIAVVQMQQGLVHFTSCLGDTQCYQLMLQVGVRTPDIVASMLHCYILKIQRRLDWAYKTANEVNKRDSECSKKQYDLNVKCTKFELGDLVLVRQKAFKEKDKISNRWKINSYHVIKYIGGHLPVYKVQLVGETRRFRFSIGICCFLLL